MSHSDRAERAGKRRRWVWVTAAALAAAAAIALLAPALLSTGPGRRWALRQANARLPGRLEVADWRLTWRRGLSARDVRYAQAGPRVEVDLAAVDSARGLWQLLRDRDDIGAVTLAGRRIAIDVSPRPPPSPGPAGRPPPGTPPPPGADATPAEPGEAAPFRLRGRVAVRLDELALTGTNGVAFCLTNLTADVAMDGAGRPIAYTLAAGAGGGGIAAAGALTPDGAGRFDPATLGATARLAVRDVAIGPAVALARAFAPLPDAAGRLTVEIEATSAGTNRLEARGRIAVADLALAGGPLRGDTPRLDALELRVDAARSNGVFALRDLVFQAPFGNGQVRGTFAPSPAPARFPTAAMSGDAHLDLARLTALLPQTLRLRPGLTLREGTLAVKGQVRSTAAALAFDADIGTSRLAAVRDGQTLTMDTPVRITAVGSLGERGLTLEDFTLEAPFAKAQGSGTPDDLSVELTGDLTAAQAELRKFFDVWRDPVAGRLTLRARVRRMADSARTIAAQMAVDQPVIGGIAPRPLRLDRLRADVGARLEAPPGGSGGAALADIRFRLEADALAANGTLARLTPSTAGRGPALHELRVQATGDVARLVQTARDAGWLTLTNEFPLTGPASIELSAAGAERAVDGGGGAASNLALRLDSGLLKARARAAALRLPNRAEPARLESLAVEADAELPAVAQLAAAAGALSPAAASALTGSAHITLGLAAAALPQAARPGRADGLTLALRSDALTGAASLDAAHLPAAGQPLAADGIRVAVTGELARLTALAAASRWLPANRPAPALSGPVRLQAGARTLALAGAGQPGRIADASFALDSEPLTATGRIARATLPPGDGPVGVDGARLGAAGELERLVRLAADAGLLTNPPPFRLVGSARLDIAAAGTGRVVRIPDARLAVRGFRYEAGDARVEEPALDLQARLVAAPDAVEIERIDFVSRPLELRLAGSLRGPAGARRLALKGTHTCDLARLGALAEAFGEVKIDMAGRREQSIVFEGPLGNGSATGLLGRATATTQVYVQRLSWNGYTLGECTAPLDLADGCLRTTVEATMNQGQLSLAPVIDFRRTPAVLEMTAERRVFSSTTMGDTTVNALLSRFHPVLQGSALVNGMMNLDMTRCRVPLDDTLATAATFAGALSVTNLHLQASGLVGELLSLCRLKHREAVVPQETVRFECRDGRVASSPLRITAGKTVLSLAGSVGLDGSLRYAAEVPVTAEMVGERYAKYAEGVVVKLPITGTVSRPKVSSEALQSLLATLAQKAAENYLQEQGAKLLEEKGAKLLEGLLKPRE